MHACWRCQIQVPETNGLCIAREEFITYGHSSLRRSLRLPLVGRLRLTFRANFSFTAFPNLPPTLRAKRTKRRNSIIKFSFTTFPFSDSDLFDVGSCPVTWESNRTLVVPLDRGCVLSHAGVVEARILDADSSSQTQASFSSARTTKRFPVVAVRVSNPDCTPRRASLPQTVHAYVLRLKISRYSSNKIMAPTTDMIKPAGCPGLYQPRAWPR